MKKRVYLVRTEGSDYLTRALPRCKYLDYGKAVAFVKAVIKVYLEYKKRDTSDMLVHTCERENDVLGYRIQMVFSHKGWYTIVIARVEPSWDIYRDE